MSNLEGLEQHIESTIERIVAAAEVPGIAVGVSIQGSPIYCSYGFTGLDRKHKLSEKSSLEIGSFYQLLISLTALHTIETGRIDIKTNVSELLPMDVSKTFDGVTLSNLLSHATGISALNMSDLDVIHNMSDSEFRMFLDTLPKLSEPGTLFNFQYFNYLLISKILEEMTGQNMNSNIDQLILQPLNISNCRCDIGMGRSLESYYYDLLQKSFTPAEKIDWCPYWDDVIRNLYLSLEDMISIGNMLLGHGECPSISETVRNGLLRTRGYRWPCMTTNSRGEQIPDSYGLGVARYGPEVIGPVEVILQDSVSCRIAPNYDVVVVVCCGWIKPQLRNLIVREVFEFLRIPFGTSNAETLFIEEGASSLAGTYKSGEHTTLVATVNENTLRVLPGYNPCLPRSYRNYEVIFEIESKNKIKLLSEMQDISIGFGIEHSSMRPYIMKGVNSFIRTH